MSELLEAVADFAAKYAVVQAALAAGVFIYLYQMVIKPGEKEPPTEEDLRAKWQQQTDLHDISENLKLLVIYQKETRDGINRLASVIWNRQQIGP